MGRKAYVVPSCHEEFSTEGCETKNRNKRFAVSDEDKTVIFLNPNANELCSTLIDGCVVKSGIRADNVVSEDGNGHVVIEFKGHDLKHAYEQLEQTTKLWNTHRVKPLEKIAGLILCNRVPKAPKTSDLQLKYARSFKAQLTVRSHHPGIAFSINDLLTVSERKPGRT